jgi:hypothetical protein
MGGTGVGELATNQNVSAVFGFRDGITAEKYLSSTNTRKCEQ